MGTEKGVCVCGVCVWGVCVCVCVCVLHTFNSYISSNFPEVCSKKLNTNISNMCHTVE